MKTPFIEAERTGAKSICSICWRCSDNEVDEWKILNMKFLKSPPENMNTIRFHFLLSYQHDTSLLSWILVYHMWSSLGISRSDNDLNQTTLYPCIEGLCLFSVGLDRYIDWSLRMLLLTRGLKQGLYVSALVHGHIHMRMKLTGLPYICHKRQEEVAIGMVKPGLHMTVPVKLYGREQSWRRRTDHWGSLLRLSLTINVFSQRSASPFAVSVATALSLPAGEPLPEDSPWQ